MTHMAVWALTESEAHCLGDALAEQTEAAIDLAAVAANRWRVTAYFAKKPNAKLLDHIAADSIGGRVASVKIVALADRDWVAKSLGALSPVGAGRFLIHGSHDRDRRRSNDIAIEIDAAMAFGTGHHGSTLGCLTALDIIGKRRSFETALDIGTGSGVLGIAIAKAWRTPVLATEIDPVAVAIARENAALNGVRGLVNCIEADGLHHPAIRRRRRFDLIVANILAGPLARLAPTVSARLAPGGLLVLSGLLQNQKRWLLAAYRAHGLTIIGSLSIDDWLTLTLVRPQAAPRSRAIAVRTAPD